MPPVASLDRSQSIIPRRPFSQDHVLLREAVPGVSNELNVLLVGFQRYAAWALSSHTIFIRLLDTASEYVCSRSLQHHNRED